MDVIVGQAQGNVVSFSGATLDLIGRGSLDWLNAASLSDLECGFAAWLLTLGVCGFIWLQQVHADLACTRGVRLLRVPLQLRRWLEEELRQRRDPVRGWLGPEGTLRVFDCNDAWYAAHPAGVCLRELGVMQGAVLPVPGYSRATFAAWSSARVRFDAWRLGVLLTVSNQVQAQVRALVGKETGRRVCFTAREEECAVLLLVGRTVEEMAQLLGIGSASVRSHIEHIYAKLDVDNQRQAVVRLTQLGYAGLRGPDLAAAA